MMQEPAIEDLADAQLANDVPLAETAEEQFGALLRPENSPHRRRAAALELLKFVSDHPAAPQRLFSAYAWARVAPVYRLDEAALFPPIVSIIEAKDASIALRQAFIYGLFLPSSCAVGTPTSNAATLACSSFPWSWK